MKGDLTCVGGRLMRHDPQDDDPDLETDVGECPDCSGDGCGDWNGDYHPGKDCVWREDRSHRFRIRRQLERNPGTQFPENMEARTMTEITKETLDELRKVAEAATPGPWTLSEYDYDRWGNLQYVYGVVGANQPRIAVVQFGIELGDDKQPQVNAAHIAAFDPPTVVALIALAREGLAGRAEIDRLDGIAVQADAVIAVARARVKVLKAALKEIVNQALDIDGETRLIPDWKRSQKIALAALSPQPDAASTPASRMTLTQPCDVCGKPVLVNAISPSACHCSPECTTAYVDEPDAAPTLARTNQTKRAPVKPLFTSEWLRDKIASDPDVDTEAGGMAAQILEHAKATGNLNLTYPEIDELLAMASEPPAWDATSIQDRVADMMAIELPRNGGNWSLTAKHIVDFVRSTPAWDGVERRKGDRRETMGHYLDRSSSPMRQRSDRRHTPTEEGE